MPKGPGFACCASSHAERVLTEGSNPYRGGVGGGGVIAGCPRVPGHARSQGAFANERVPRPACGQADPLISQSPVTAVRVPVLF